MLIGPQNINIIHLKMMNIEIMQIRRFSSWAEVRESREGNIIRR